MQASKSVWHRAFSVVLAIVLAVGLMPLPVWGTPTEAFGETPEPQVVFSGGIGTEEDPYLISSADDMRELAEAVNSGTFDTNGLFFLLTNDIDLGGAAHPWTPIGFYNLATPLAMFHGTFDGGSHTISGLYVNTDEHVAAGVFGYASSNVVIKNLVVDGFVRSSGAAGGIVGQVGSDTASSKWSNASFINCGNEAEIQSTWYIGGIVGSMSAAPGTGNGIIEMIGCWNSGTIGDPEAVYVASQAGGLTSGNAYTVTNCVNFGEVRAKAAGGLLGEVPTTGNLEMTSCYNVGKVISAGGNYGGIAFTLTSNANYSNVFYSTASSDQAAARVIEADSLSAVSEQSMTTRSFSDALGDGFVYNPGGFPLPLAQMNYMGEPWFSEQPADVTLELGDDPVVLSVTAKRPGAGPSSQGVLTYQWYQGYAADGSDASALEGETYMSFTPSVDQPGKTYYSCKVTNTYEQNGVSVSKTAESARACVTVTSSATPAALPRIVGQPIDQEIEYGKTIDELAVATEMSGDGAGTLSYQWYANDSSSFEGARVLEGATSRSYTPAAILGTTYYFCEVTNTFEGTPRTATVKSETAAVTVLDHATISSVAEFVQLRDNVLDGLNYDGVVVSLATDLDLSEVCGKYWGNWQPIGTQDTPFAGTFDGGYHAISGLFINNATEDGQGLFGWVNSDSAEIKNFVLSGSVSGTSDVLAGAVGICSSTTKFPDAARIVVSNIKSQVEVVATGEGVCAGGVVGAADVSVARCISSGVVRAESGKAGGIAGHLEGRANATSCYNTATVTGGIRAGGIAGLFAGGTVSYSYNVGIVSADAGDAGAILGSLGKGVNNLYLDSSCAYAAGGANEAGFTPKTDAQLKEPTTATELGSDFASEAGAYPLLLWQDYRAGAPVITQDPLDGFVAQGETAQPLLVAAEVVSEGDSATGSLSYQWYSASARTYEKATRIDGATQAEYTPPTANAGTTYYFCVVTNTFQSKNQQVTKKTSSAIARFGVTSDAVAATPSITLQPAALKTSYRGPATLVVEATSSGEGAGELSYQWYECDSEGNEATLLEGKTDAAFSPATDVVGTAYYYCQITNTFEGVKTASVSSDVAAVTIDPIWYLSDAQGLVELAQEVAGGNDFSGMTVGVVNDIDLSSIDNWIPIGLDEGTNFCGTFDGGYHTISNLKSNQSGLFYRVGGGAVIENFILQGTVVGYGVSVVGVVSEARSYNEPGTVTIKNVGNEVDVLSLFGIVDPAHAVNGRVAGILGSGPSKVDHVSIEGCYNTGTIIGRHGSTGLAVGGIFAHGSSACEISNCYNAGNITSKSSSAAGIVGTHRSTVVSNCYNTGTIKGASSWGGGVGAIAGGSVYANNAPVNCYCLATTAGKNKKGNGTPLSEEDMKAAEFAKTLSPAFVAQTGSFPLLAWQDTVGYPVITEQPQPTSCKTGSQTAALTIAAEPPALPSRGSEGTVSYQWYEGTSRVMEDAIAIEGATQARYAPPTSTAQTKYYYCAVTNTYDDGIQATLLSDTVPFAVMDQSVAAVQITTQPEAETSVTQGTGVTLSVGAIQAEEGTQGTLIYQWYRQDAPGAEGVALEGATSATLSFTAADLGDVWYYCTVSNRFSDMDFNAVSSQSAKVTAAPALTISTTEELADFARTVNEGTTYEGYTVVLTADLDLSSVCSEELGNWTPIGNSRQLCFRGIFDGQNHTISNLFLHSESNGGGWGLFGYVKGGELHNLKIEGTVVGYEHAGLLAGDVEGCAIHDVSVEGDVTSTNHYSSDVGGVIGYMTGSSSLVRVANAADVSGSQRVGGIAGSLGSSSKQLSVESCYNTGSVTASREDGRGQYAGGIFGRSYASSSEPVIVSCYNWGHVAGDDYVGGIMGDDQDYLASCYNAGTITSAGGNCGPLTSHLTSGSVFSPLNYYDETTAKDAPFGVSVNDAYLMSASFLADLGKKYVAGPGMPVLRWQGQEGYPTINKISESAVFVQGGHPGSIAIEAALPQANLVGSDGVLSYQWYACSDKTGANATALPEATENTYEISTFVDAGTTWYVCEVTNNYTDSTGAPAVKTVTSPTMQVTVVSTIDPVHPTFVTQPIPDYYELGAQEEALPLCVGVDETAQVGLGEISYQWYEHFNISPSLDIEADVALEGATEATYTPDISKVGTRYYFCVATNTFEGIKTAETASDIARITVWSRPDNVPVITQQPEGDALYTQGDVAEALSVQAVLPQVTPGNGGTLTYQWYRNTTGIANPEIDEAIADATGVSLIPDTSLDPDVYYYYCVVRDTFPIPSTTDSTSTVSEQVQIALISATAPAVPAYRVNVDALPATYTQGDTATSMHVEAEVSGPGSGDITYQWYVADTATLDPEKDRPLEGATEMTLVPSTLMQPGTYYFYCVATNTFEKVQTAQTLSNPAIIEIKPYLAIQTAQDMFDFARTVNEGTTYENLTVQLTRNIDLDCSADKQWTPIGTATQWGIDKPFKGTFDGQGYTIYGLEINGISSNSDGLFGTTENAYLHDFVVQGHIVSTAGRAAGIAGMAVNSTIVNVGNEVDVTVTNGTAAGIVAQVPYRTEPPRIDSCYNKGNLSGNGAAGIRFGKVTSSSSVTNCYNAGMVTGRFMTAAGILAGSEVESTDLVKSCYNTGVVSSEYSTTEALMPAINGNQDLTSNCYYLEGSAPSSVGKAQSAASMKNASFATQLGTAFSAVEGAFPILTWEVGERVNPPFIVTQPVGQTVEVGGAAVPLTVAAQLPPADAGELTYQWYSNTLPTREGAEALSGETGVSFTPSTTTPGFTFYFCEVANNHGPHSSSVISDIVLFSVTSDAVPATPHIERQPSALGVSFGAANELFIEASVVGEGAGRLTYQWYTTDKTFAQPETDTMIANAQATTLTPDTLKLGTSYYYCVVTNTIEGTKTAEVISDVVPVVVSSYVTISSAAELAAFGDVVNSGVDYSGIVVELANDIDLSSLCGEQLGNWSPIGATPETAFTGTFKGNGNTISGLYAHMVGETGAYNALFGAVKDATITDVVVSGHCVGSDSVAGVIGQTLGSTTVRNVGNKVEVASSGRGSGFGGVIGTNTGTLTVENCYNKGEISGYQYVGGILGQEQGTATFTSCYNTAPITSSSQNIAGIVASRNKDDSLISCYNTGFISGPFWSQGVGALAISSSPTITNGFYEASTCTRDASSAVALSEEEMKAASFAETLNAHEGTFKAVEEAYPILTWETLTTVGEAGWTLDAIPDQIATGLPLTPSVRVYDSSGALIDSSAYTVSYSDNIFAGVATVRVEAQGETIGTIQTNFDITGTVATVDIHNAKELMAFAHAVNANTSYEGLTVQLLDDIDLSQVCGQEQGNWIPIGTEATPFKGTFEGNGYTIEGLYLNTVTTGTGVPFESSQALFGAVDSALLSNFIVKGSITTTARYAAGVVGQARGTTHIANVGSVVDIVSSGSVAAGICAEGANCVGCFNEGSLKADSASGIAGKPLDTIASCRNAGSVVGSQRAAGIVADAPDNVSILGCYNSGSVSGALLASGISAQEGVYSYGCAYLDITEADNSGAEKLSAQDMKDAAFVDKLNAHEGAFEQKEDSYPALVVADHFACPLIMTQPESAFYMKDATATPLSVAAVLPPANLKGHTGQLSYQWYQASESAPVEGTPIADAQSATFIPPTDAAETLHLYCVITNTIGDTKTTRVSDMATVVVSEGALAQPILDTQPTALERTQGDETQKLSVAAHLDTTGIQGTLTYQWYVNTTESTEGAIRLPHATTSDLIPLDEGLGERWYYCVVGNAVDGVIAKTATSPLAKVTTKAIEIANAADLKALSDAVVAGATYEGQTVKLTADIDLSSVCGEGVGAWQPIGSAAHPFMGTFDGQGHVVSGLYGNTAASDQGLFGVVRSAAISNLVVRGALQGTHSTAGIVGRAISSELTHLGNECVVRGAGNDVAGVVGSLCNGSISDSYNKADVHATGEESQGCGGIAGTVMGAASEPLKDCYNSGDIYGVALVGGIAGSASGVAARCYNTGTITATTTPFAALVAKGSTYEDCYYLETTSPSEATGARALDDTTMCSEEFASTLGSAYKTTTKFYPLLVWETTKNMSDCCTIEAIPQQAWTGQAQTPEITVKDTEQNTTLTLGVDYTVSYRDNTDAGTATAIAVGCGKYCNSIEGTFEITGTDVSGATVTSISPQTFTGSALEPEVTVTLGDETLQVNDAYTVSYENNLAVGTARVVITGVAANGFTGEKIVEFTIVAADLADAQIDPLPTQYYTGAPICPEPTVKMGEVVVNPDAYTLSWESNTDISETEPKVTVTAVPGKGYKGSVSTVFTIAKADLSAMCEFSEIPDQRWTGSAITPKVVVTYNGEELDEANFTFHYDHNVDVGSGLVTIEATPESIFQGAKDLNFTIVPADLSTGSIAPIANQTYTGSAVLPRVQVTAADGRELVDGIDYEATATDNVDVGTATLTLTGKGNWAETLSTTFEIQPAQLSEAQVVDIPAQAYTGSAIEPNTLLSFKGIPVDAQEFKVSYANNVEVGTASLTATATENGNFTGSLSTSFEIVKSGQAQPSGIARANVSIEGRTDGALYNLTDKMEYKKVEDESYTAVPQGATSVEGLGVGVYLVRYAATNNQYAGLDATIAITAKEQADTSLALEGNADFGTLIEGAAVPEAHSLKLTNTGNLSATGLSATIEGTAKDAFTFELGTTVLAAQDTTTVTIAPRAGLAPGMYEGTLVITSAQNSSGVSLPLVLKVEPIPSYELSLSTNTIDLGQVEDGYAEEVSKTVEISNTGNQPLRIRALCTGAAGITVEPSSATLKANETINATIHAAAGLAVGDHTATLIVIADHDIYESAAVSFTVNAIDVSWERIAGENRYETMRNVVSTAFAAENTNTVLIASGANFPDALSASGLAGIEQAPIVLADGAGETLDADSRAVLESLKPSRAIIVGGTSSISPAIESEIQSLIGDGTTERVSGVSRESTAVEIYRLQAGEGAWSQTCIIAAGQSFADAISISPYAYANRSPIFLATKEKVLTDETLSAIVDGGFTHIVVLGGEGSVSSTALDQLMAAGVSADSITRLGGENRYETSSLIATFSVDPTHFDDPSAVLSYETTAFAWGGNFPDALAGGALLGRLQGVLMLVEQDTPLCIDQNLKDNADAVRTGYIIGGENAVPNSIMDQCEKITTR